MKIVGSFVTVIGVIMFLLWGGGRFYKSAVTWEQNVHGHLKRAADANTIQLAKTELETALRYIEANNLTSGYTSIWWNTPDEDLDFWHRNLSESLVELSKCEAECTGQYEQTNVLMKLRETLLDEGETTRVTVPRGISIFPNNTAFMWWGILSLVFMVVGVIMIVGDEF